MKVRVFQNQYGFNILAKNKMLNGEELKYYLPVSFKRGEEPNGEKIDIDIKDGWFTCYNNRDGETRPKFFVNKYDIIWDTPKADNEMAIKPDELPFY